MFIYPNFLTLKIKIFSGGSWTKLLDKQMKDHFKIYHNIINMVGSAQKKDLFKTYQNMDKKSGTKLVLFSIISLQFFYLKLCK